MLKPYADSCEQNKHVILDVLSTTFIDPGSVLEIGSGTGQHAVFFARQLPWLQWQPSERTGQLMGIQLWLDEAQLDNILPPQALDVLSGDWPARTYDYAFSANTLHIMSWSGVEKMFEGIANILKTGGKFAVYGPFNYNGSYTSESNARFDNWLKARDPLSAIRHFEKCDRLAEANGLALLADHAMPANNRTLIWEKQ
jgi:SAM-dependent methyltransferase